MRKIVLIIVVVTLMFGCAQPITVVPEYSAVASAAPVPILDSSVKAVNLSIEEHNALNIFFSNFFEAYFDTYNENTANNQLISFAVIHNKINYHERVLYVQANNGEYYCKINGQYVADTIENFFGKKLTLAGTDDYFYQNGAVYFPAASGETYNYFAQTQQCLDNDDGTWSVLVAKYHYGGNAHDAIDPSVYNPQETWSENLRNQCEYQALYQAKIKIMAVNGTNIYQLLTINRLESEPSVPIIQVSSIFPSGVYQEISSNDYKSARITIKNYGNNQLEVEGNAFYASSSYALEHGGVNIGEISGLATITKSKAVYVEGDNILTFTLLPNGNIAVEEIGSFGGFNVTFKGEYKRQ